MTMTAATAPATPTARRYGFLGPAGTFTEMALRSRPESEGAESVAFASVDLALTAVRDGEVDGAMVPIENSVEGGVSATLDALTRSEGLVIVGEALVPITFVLAAPAGTTLEQVRRIGTHPHAWAQVRGWVAQHLPDALYVPAGSTAAAAAALSGAPQEPSATGAEGAVAGSGKRTAYDAAVCAPVAASNQGLTVLADGIEDRTGAVTRFVLVSRAGVVPEPTGADKTTVVLFQREDHPGGLLSFLEQFATRGINLSRIESRPTGERLGDYCFSIDCEGHVADERVGEALMGLRRVCAQVRFLGSYGRADLAPATVAADTTDDAFIEARDWLGMLRRPLP
jgi:prephenate dehydratase